MRPNFKKERNTFTVEDLDDPVIGKIATLAEFKKGNVSETRFGGGLGESTTGMTQDLASRDSVAPGNKLQVWPSGPIPRMAQSNLGYFTPEKGAFIHQPAYSCTSDISRLMLKILNIKLHILKYIIY